MAQYPLPSAARDLTPILKRISRSLQQQIKAVEPFCSSNFHHHNNQIYRLTVNQSTSLLLKRYYPDNRNRGHREWQALRHLWQRGLRCIPLPVLRFTDIDATVLEFVNGVPLDPATAPPSFLTQAGQCLGLLSSPAITSDPPPFPQAIGASLSLQSFLFTMRERLSALSFAPETLPPKLQEALTHKDLLQCLKQLITKLEAAARQQLDTLPQTERVLSNGDPGLHNLLVHPNSSLTLLDFEYAGWDDSHQVASAFLLSDSGINLPPASIEAFLEGYRSALQVPWRSERWQLLTAMQHTAWCTIYLHSLTPAVLQRKQFANAMLNSTTYIERQLQRFYQRLPLAHEAIRSLDF